MLPNSQSKFCTKCNTFKVKTSFGKDSTRREGLCIYCKVCTNSVRRASKKKNRANNVKYNREYRAKNREKWNENERRYYSENSEKLGANAKKWRESYSGTFRLLHIAAKARAKKKGLPYLIDDKVMIEMSRAQADRCALTGIDFDFTSELGFINRPYAPSVDRIDNSKGYTPDNIQIVCVIVNKAKNEYPQDMFDEMCLARVRQLEWQRSSASARTNT